MALELITLNGTKDFLDLAQKFGNEPPIRRILLASETVGCKTVIVETDFSDEEYSKEYEMFYKNIFLSKDLDKTIRIHLFEGVLKNIEVAELKNNQKKYLGYVTLRPLNNRKICDAFISENIIIDEKSRFVFLICKMEKKVQINTVDFVIKGFPYMQQENRIAACAQCAVRIISQFLAWKDDIPQALTAPEITKKVKSVLGNISSDPSRQLPAKGLSIHQLKAALESLECDPMIYDFTNTKPEDLFYKHPEQIIYRYLESGIPVCVGIKTAGSGHAIVVIGHTFNPDLWWHYVSEDYYKIPQSGTTKNRNDAKYHSSVSWIQNYIVQDDNLGPYYFMDKLLLLDRVFCVAVPLPSKVCLSGEDAEQYAVGVIYRESSREIYNQVGEYLVNNNSLNLEWFNCFLKAFNEQELVVRTYLRKSDELKSDVEKFTRTGVVKQSILKTEMPEYIWAIEISWPNIFSHIRKKCGEIILDATADSQFDQALLFMHLPGFVIKKVGDTYEHKIIFGEDDQPFRHLYRKEQPIPKNLPRGQVA